jgi:4-amino-4-deoxy-L-arabinose transferase-like glycosyltransferase
VSTSTVALGPIGFRSPRWSAALGDIALKYFWWCFAGVLALMAWNVFWRLGVAFVRDYDEARYGVAASEMLHHHSMLVTTYAGATEFWNLKPPLGYWLLELSFQVMGETPFALRLPAALCALLTTAATMLMARRIAGARVAILAGIILATSFGFLRHYGARGGELDSPLTLLMFAFLMLAPRLTESRSVRLAAGLVLALGFLLKSFAILPYITAIAVYCLLTRGVASWRAWPLPLGITAVVVAIWAAARSVSEDSGEFVRRMFVEDLLLRSTTVIDPGANHGSWDYVGALFDRLAPWPLLVLIAFFLSGNNFARHLLGRDPAVLMWCFALVPLGLFTLAQTHHFHYITPTYPAWAILGAASTLKILERARRIELAAPVAALIVAGAVACEGRLVAQTLTHDSLHSSQVFLASLRDRFADATVLHTAFVPSYSERFFLQVVDGFTVDDSGAAALSSARSLPAGSRLLVRRPDLQWSDLPPAVAGFAVLAQNERYTLFQLSSTATGPQLVSRSSVVGSKPSSDSPASLAPSWPVLIQGSSW